MAQTADRTASVASRGPRWHARWALVANALLIAAILAPEREGA